MVFLIYNPKQLFAKLKQLKAEYFQKEIKQKAVQAKKSVR